MEAKLVVVGGEAKARQYDLHLPAVIGRSRGVDLTLGHPLVSRKHCEVFEANGMLMVRDLGSLNGTFVGDQRIAEQAIPIKPGDLITVGPVTFRAEYRTSSLPAEAVSWNAYGPTVDAPLPGHEASLKKTPARHLKRLPGKNDDDTSPRSP